MEVDATMRRSVPARLLVLAAVLLPPGCGRSARQPAVHPGATVHFELDGRRVAVEVAYEHSSRMAGLMFRESLAEDAGMLFVYPTPEPLSFWMRNTYLPLSIAFLDDDGTVLQIERMKPKDERSVPSKYKVRYALEMNEGWFERAGIRVGDRLPGFREKVEPFRDRAEPAPRARR